MIYGAFLFVSDTDKDCAKVKLHFKELERCNLQCLWRPLKKTLVAARFSAPLPSNAARRVFTCLAYNSQHGQLAIVKWSINEPIHVCSNQELVQIPERASPTELTLYLGTEVFTVTLAALPVSKPAFTGQVVWAALCKENAPQYQY
jgi:hypothetical protein